MRATAKLLIASPQMVDPFFHGAVVLVWDHDEAGAIGVIVNKGVDVVLTEALSFPDDIDLAPYRGVKLAWGGPVESASGTVVIDGEVDDEQGWNLDAAIGVTRSLDELHTQMRRGAKLMLHLGYAGWGPGQLDQEIEEGGWIVTDVWRELVLELPLAERYDLALASLGLTRHGVVMQPGEA